MKSKSKNIPLKILCTAAVLIFAASLFIIIPSAAPDSGLHEFGVDIASGVDGEAYIVYPDENNNIYLSNATDTTKLKIYFNENYQVTYGKPGRTDGRRVAVSGETIDLTGFETTDMGWTVEFFVNAASVGEYCFRLPGHVGAIYVTTQNGLASIDEIKEKQPVTAIITGIDGQLEYSDIALESNSKLKSRGNATWTYAKKAYNITLSESTRILGMTSNKNWVLIANYIDQSMIRNAIAYKLGAEMGMEYTPEFVYADLYVDGEYRGLYMVTDKIEVGKNRISINDLDKANKAASGNVTKDNLSATSVRSGSVIDNSILTSYYYVKAYNTPDDITGGYLVELDNLYYGGELCRFTTNDALRYVVKSPEYATKSEMEYISLLFAQGEEAINSENGYNSYGRHFSEYFDIRSLAQAYCVAEVLKNWDGFYSSTFFYKDSDKNGVTTKIFAGPLWDYDNSLGNINSGSFTSRTDDLWTAEPSDGRNKSMITNLMTHPEFLAEVDSVYSEMQPIIASMLANGGYIDSLVSEINKSVMNDYIVWNKSSSRKWPLSYSGGHTGKGFFQYKSTYNSGSDSAIGFLKKFFNKRNGDMQSKLGDYELDTSEYYTVSISSELADKVTVSCEYVERGCRASFRAEASLNGKFAVQSSDGTYYRITQSSTGSGYEDGIFAFRMPACDVTVVPCDISYDLMDLEEITEEETTEEITEEITEKTTSEAATETETVTETAIGTTAALSDETATDTDEAPIETATDLPDTAEELSTDTEDTETEKSESADASDDTTAEDTEKSSGCGSVCVLALPMALPMALIGCFVFKRRKSEEK